METPRLLVARYRLIEPLGTGGMSVVWRARDEVLGRDVAVKVLAARFASDVAFRNRLRAEAQAAASLAHPNVASVYDYGEARGERGAPEPYVVMQLLDGAPLSQRLRGGQLPWRVAVEICTEVAAALSAAHANGIAHRDVTPANIIITPNGARVVDFGISAVVGELESEEQAASAMGTPAYLAPERLAGDLGGPAADMYALGLVLYQALSGSLPWPAETWTEMFVAHQYEEPAPLPPIPGLPIEVASACHRCLAKDPAARPTSAQLARKLARTVKLRVAVVDPAAEPGAGAPGAGALEYGALEYGAEAGAGARAGARAVGTSTDSRDAMASMAGARAEWASSALAALRTSTDGTGTRRRKAAAGTAGTAGIAASSIAAAVGPASPLTAVPAAPSLGDPGALPQAYPVPATVPLTRVAPVAGAVPVPGAVPAARRPQPERQREPAGPFVFDSHGEARLFGIEPAPVRSGRPGDGRTGGTSAGGSGSADAGGRPGGVSFGGGSFGGGSFGGGSSGVHRSPEDEEAIVHPWPAGWVVGIWALTAVLVTALVTTVVVVAFRDADNPLAGGGRSTPSATSSEGHSGAEATPSGSTEPSANPSRLTPTPTTSGGASAVPGVGTSAGATSGQPATCLVRYGLDQSSDGATIRLTVTNVGRSSVNGWTLAFDLGADMRVQQGWNGVWTQTGRAVSVRNADYNAQLAPGQALADVGAYLVGQPGRNPAPGRFSLNGRPCQGP